jgi:DNA-binding CsgD family transcriptional regulator
VLSKRELEILDLITRGVSNGEVGRRLFISIGTVKAHVTHIFDKLSVNNRIKAALVLVEARMRNSCEFSPQPAPYSGNHRDSPEDPITRRISYHGT